ncbi:MAG: Gfo/Idh/MocA family oxidoreductase [Chitinispirillaceae bacterium]|nr:Gfo/Idh/MocA family oxidoreductase [Chitinispirillaceae bacterium]
MIKIGVVGCGYWGPNIIRNFSLVEDTKVVAVCDKKEVALNRIKKIYPDLNCTTNENDIINSSEIDCVAVVTPVSTHYPLSKKVLENGKHLFVEKPFTTTCAEAEKLINLAESKRLIIMVDHTFLFTGAVRKMKEIIDRGDLGTIYYYDSTRINLGLFQHDVNVIWDLAPHDFSIMNYLIKEKPAAVLACGQCHIDDYDKENLAYITVFFNSNMIAHFNVNWLSPVKVRNTIIGGEKKMLLWDDMLTDEKIRVYDKGIEVKSVEGIYELLVSYRSSDMWSPKVDQTEALSLECRYFIDCIKSGKKPFNDGEAGLQVVKMLEACDQSIKENCKMIYLDR